MSSVRQKRLIIVATFLAGLAVFLVTHKLFNTTALASASGPEPGFTHAPGEFDCSECHVPTGSGTGQISITVPQNYIPGQTYQITVTHTSPDSTRRRWGFQLTVLDDLNLKAGNLQNINSLTQVLNNAGPGNSRQYIEHASGGTFDNQQGGASWTFNWTAPAADIGPVTFYAAGNQANFDGNTSGDYVYFTFNQVQPASSGPPELRLEQSGPDPSQAAAFDSLLLTRDPFRVQSVATWWNLGSDSNTRVMVFAANLGTGSVIVSLVDAVSNNFDIPAEDVRAVPNSDLSQVVFKLPTGLAMGTCTVKVKVGSLVSNAGTFRVVP